MIALACFFGRQFSAPAPMMLGKEGRSIQDGRRSNRAFGTEHLLQEATMSTAYTRIDLCNG